MDVLLGVLFKSNQKQCHFLKARRVWKDNPGIRVCVCVCTHKYMCMLTYFYTYVLRACSMLVWSWIWVEWGFPGGASGKDALGAWFECWEGTLLRDGVWWGGLSGPVAKGGNANFFEKTRPGRQSEHP